MEFGCPTVLGSSGVVHRQKGAAAPSRSAIAQRFRKPVRSSSVREPAIERNTGRDIWMYKLGCDMWAQWGVRLAYAPLDPNDIVPPAFWDEVLHRFVDESLHTRRCPRQLFARLSHKKRITNRLQTNTRTHAARTYARAHTSIHACQSLLTECRERQELTTQPRDHSLYLKRAELATCSRRFAEPSRRSTRSQILSSRASLTRPTPAATSSAKVPGRGVELSPRSFLQARDT